MKMNPTKTRKQSQTVFMGNSELAFGSDLGGWTPRALAYLLPLIFFLL